MSNHKPNQRTVKPPETEKRSYDRIALVISILAFIASGFSAWYAGRQFESDEDFRRRMVRPELTISVTYGTKPYADKPGLSYKIENIGTGQATISWFQVEVDGIARKNWGDMLVALGEDMPVAGVSYVHPDGTSWPPGTAKDIFKIDEGPSAEILRKHMGRIELRTCYCSVLDSCWTSTLQGMVKVNEIKSCEPKPNIWFGHGKRDELEKAGA